METEHPKQTKPKRSLSSAAGSVEILKAIPIPTIVARVDDGAILAANGAAADLMGVSCAALRDRTILEFYCDRTVWHRLLRDLPQDKPLQDCEIQYRKADGTAFSGVASLQRLTFQGEQAIISLLRDIQDRKQTEIALQEKESFLQLVLDNIPQLIFWKDRRSTFLGCNRLWAKAVGLEHPDDAIGKTDRDLCTDPRDADTYIAKDRQVMETGAAEFQLEYKPDKDVWFDTKKIPIYDLEGRVVGILATTENITERKKAEEALRLAEENYRSIFENALEGIFQASPDGRFIRVNPAMARIYGYSSPDAMVAHIQNIGQQLYVEPNCWTRFQRQMADDNRVKDFEYQAYQQDGKIIWVEEDARAVRDASGQLLYYEGIIQDISQRKREEDALKQQVKALQVEIDQQKLTRQVSEITQTDYFQTLKARAKDLRREHQDG